MMAVSSLASAQQSTVPERIIVTGRAGTAPGPETVSVIDADTLDDLAPLRIGEALDLVSGVFTAGLNGPREVVQIRSPLSFANRTLFVEDGVPLQSAVFFDQSALGYSQALASRGGIEVLRGPGGTLYGSDAFSGVVSLRTVAPDAGPALSGRLRYGSFERVEAQASARAALSQRHSVRASGAFAATDGYRAETAFHRSHGVLRHRYQADRVTVTSGLYVTDFETESATAIPFDAFLAGSRASGLNAAVDPEAAIEEGRYWRLQSRFEGRLDDGLSLAVTPYLRRQQVAATAVFQPATTPRRTSRADSFGLLPRLSWQRGATRIIGGLDVELTNLDVFEVQDRPDAVVFGTLFRQGPQFDYRVGFRSLSPFIRAEREVGPLTLTAGLRYDRLRYRFRNALDEVPGDARLQLDDRLDRFEALSPELAALWALDGHNTIRLRYARGFRVPRASDLYELAEDQTAFSLDPEKLDSFELGWRGRFDRLSLDLTGYWQISRDGVLTDVQTAAGNISINGGSQRFAGIEASLSAALDHGFDASLVFAWQDFRFRQRSATGDDPFDGNRLAQAPRRIGTAMLQWTPPSADWLTLSGRLRHIGPWPLNDANTLFTEDEFILGLQAIASIGDRLQLDIKADNVTDAIYPVFANAPGFAPSGRARPGDGRAISVGLRLAL